MQKEIKTLHHDFLFIKKKRCIHKIFLKDIYYLEIQDKYCSIYTEQTHFIIKLSLVKIKKLIIHKPFIQVHRKYMVNIDKIKQIYIEDNLIILENNSRIILSERYKAAFSKKFIVLR